MPARMKRLVDLPQPEGPSSATNSPSSIVRFRSGMTSTSPNRLTTWRNSTLATVSALHAADRHLHQVALRGEIEDQARDQVEHPDRGDDAVVHAHHVVADVIHIEAHRPVGVADQEREHKDVLLPAPDKRKDGYCKQPVSDLRQHHPEKSLAPRRTISQCAHFDVPGYGVEEALH